MSQQQGTEATAATKLPISFDNVPGTDLESMRLQLNKLISSLKNLQQQLLLPSASLSNTNTPIISWTKLSERVETAVNHLNKFQKNIIQFDNYNVYPNVGKFPVEEEELINVLLRKKNLPEIDNLYADLVKLGSEKIAEYRTKNSISAETDDEAVIKEYFTANDTLIYKSLKALKETKKTLFAQRDTAHENEGDLQEKIDPATYVIKSEMISFDIEAVYKFMYSGAKKQEQEDVVML